MPHKEANDKVTISTFQLFAMFPDQESARKYLEGRLWPDGAKCPICTSGDGGKFRRGSHVYNSQSIRNPLTVPAYWP